MAVLREKSFPFVYPPTQFVNGDNDGTGPPISFPRELLAEQFRVAFRSGRLPAARLQEKVREENVRSGY
ncbi:MAG TPA: hypothetical protein VNA69_00590 [Thermoanaerobaculia bacterium]|nr:hypothetical protein [Thermoanaerobaculia bacterium]